MTRRDRESRAEQDPIDDTAGIYERLRADLISGSFPPGTALSEAMLTARYQVSRTPIREALARLDQDSLAVRGPRGYQVRVVSPADVLEIYEARIALEAVAAADAADRRTELELARLRKIHDQMCTATEEDVILQANSRFHTELWAAAHNTTIATLLQRLSAQLKLFDRGARSIDDLECTTSEHRQILDAVAARDSTAAHAAATTHLARTRAERIEHFAQSDLT
jgi:DNA-binding GntR family transcriptional regulator